MTLTHRIESLAQTFTGLLGVTAINLTTHERFDYNAQQSFYPASTIKLPLLVETLRGVVEGRWQLDDPLILTAENVVSGSGVLCDLTPGLTLSIRDIATLMITVSDNTATNMLVDLCTTAALNQTMLEFGIQGVRMNRKIGLNVDQIALGEATPLGMARLMELIATRAILTPDAAKVQGTDQPLYPRDGCRRGRAGGPDCLQERLDSGRPQRRGAGMGAQSYVCTEHVQPGLSGSPFLCR
jgi:hypothetical protein